jgi:hypothetical protein
MDGRLVAIAGADGPDQVAFPSGDAVARLAALIAAGTGRQSSAGVALQPIGPDLADLVGDQGVLVSDLVPGGPAEQAGIEPGDVLLSIGNTPTSTVDDVRLAMAGIPPGADVVIGTRRGGEPRPVALIVSSAFEMAARARSAATPDLSSTPRAGDLFPEAWLDASAVPAEARVLAVNDRPPPAPAQMARELRRAGGPALLYLALDGRRFFAALRPEP